ncbi:YhcH/YjgK/YiaL family protein [Enterococcus timonensis]|uniref:YhcH/YjgK/YiaL family protein n=1 Tax=Enterococcus timonensis TaxID=1852364 RepID=UPI0008D8FA59|nr:YhcH/YjgK/YiaL family protein [Enterococcus timonensis]
MLFSSTKDLTKVSEILPELKKVQDFLASFKASDFVAGTSIQVADNIKANLISYDTKSRAAGFWEAHEKMVDVHYILEGSELVDLNFDDTLKKDVYQPEKEMYELFGEPTDTIRLDEKNNFLLLFPHEAHRTGVQEESVVSVKKIVFKIG